VMPQSATRLRRATTTSSTISCRNSLRAGCLHDRRRCISMEPGRPRPAKNAIKPFIRWFLETVVHAADLTAAVGASDYSFHAHLAVSNVMSLGTRVVLLLVTLVSALPVHTSLLCRSHRFQHISGYMRSLLQCGDDAVRN
jgi:hypothetical protein